MLVFKNIVNAKINKTEEQATRVKINVQIESASSNSVASLLLLIALDMVDSIEKESLFKKRFNIIGSINTTIAIMAIIPQEFLISDRLEETVLSASLTDEPTKGTKLLMAKRAVFKERVSTLCERVFL